MRKKFTVLTGLSCNCNCIFCLQIFKDKTNKTTKQLLSEIKNAKDQGYDEITFSGGETSIRKDFFDLLSFTKEIGFPIIQVQTNGRRFFYQKFMKHSVELGLNEIMFSIHASNAKIHNALTRTPDSYEQVYSAIKNALKHDIKVITNTVIVEKNYRLLPNIAKQLTELKVDQIQFGLIRLNNNTFHHMVNLVPKMSKMVPYLSKALNICQNKKIIAIVEDVPYCILKGHEKEIIEYKNETIHFKGLKKTVRNYNKVLNLNKEKFDFCESCDFNKSCCGVLSSYIAIHGKNEFTPISKKD